MVIERLFPAFLRIVELHRSRIKHLTVEAPTGPLQRRLVLLVIRLGDDLKELGIAVHTTAVLGRTPTFTRDTTRVPAVVVGTLEALMDQDVLPVVAEVARVVAQAVKALEALDGSCSTRISRWDSSAPFKPMAWTLITSSR